MEVDGEQLRCRSESLAQRAQHGDDEARKAVDRVLRASMFAALSLREAESSSTSAKDDGVQTGGALVDAMQAASLRRRITAHHRTLLCRYLNSLYSPLY